GQHDTYLNVVGLAAIFQHVSRCCGSPFTEPCLTLQELQNVVRTQPVDDLLKLVRQRTDTFGLYKAVTPPRVLTSEGEAVAGRTDARQCRPARWSAYRFPPEPSRSGPESSWTWRR